MKQMINMYKTENIKINKILGNKILKPDLD
jgi:hypothetical protein